MLAVLLVGIGIGVGVAMVLASGAEEDTADFCRFMGGPPHEGVSYVVFMAPDASAREAEAVGDHLASIAGVEDLSFVDQEAAYQEAMDMFEGQPETQDMLELEDVPPSWRFLHRGSDLRPELAPFTAIRAIESSDDQGLTLRAIDLLGDLAEGEELARFRVFDAAAIEALRETVPGAVKDAADTVVAWLGEIARPRDGTGEPPAAVRSAADELVAATDEHCGLRPNRP